MDAEHPRPRLERFFRALVGARIPILVVYGLLAPAAVVLALRVPSDGAIDRLVVASDPDYVATRAFQKVFPEGEHVVLLVEADDPFAPDVVSRVAALEERLAAVPGVQPFSAWTLFRRSQAGAAADAAAFRRFATGTTMLRRQGLVGDGFLGITIEMKVDSGAARDAALAGIEAILGPFLAGKGPIRAIRRVGGPYVDAYLERETSRASFKYFPLFGAFIVVLVVGLYRSKRALAAFLITLAVAVALSTGFAAIVGWSFTIVSSLVPLTVLITATATMVYVHSRFVEQPEHASLEEHQAVALANKFLPCTASVFAAIVGFAALSVSRIRPIYEMGLWTAAGLAITWVVCFTLFPALQRVVRTPTHLERRTAVRWYPKLVDVLVPFSYRWRWALVFSSVLIMALGAAALFGIPGRFDGMRLETDALDYIDKDLDVYKDTRRFERAISGLTVAEIWVKTPGGSVVEPAVLRGLESFARRLEADPRVGSVTGPTTLLRWIRYLGGGGDHLPDDPAAWPKLAGDLEQLMLTEPSVRGFVDVDSLGSARLTVITRGSSFGGLSGLREFFLKAWADTAAREPGLASATVEVVGEGLLSAKIAHYLVPTLVESFALTAGVIFLAFLVLFRSGAARLMAMIPSVFAILAMFLVMRIFGIPLNVATILIASTVLGASENDQIHFFYHFQERRRTASTEQALRHAMLVAGRAIVFATFINAGGFLALAFSDLPPMRQFGIVTSSAFVLAMIADFTALPAALWLFFREKPDGPA